MARYEKAHAVTKRGRPSLYTPEIADEICERLADGETLISICEAKNMPTEAAVRQWAHDDREGFSSRYAKARENGYARMADQIIAIADDKSGDPARDRLRLDTRKWLLSKALPKVYGDRLTHDGNIGITVKIDRDDAGVL